LTDDVLPARIGVVAAKQIILAETRAAFTAEGCAPSAVVCLVFEDDPCLVENPEFGTFETWTKANAFATELNRSLGISQFEARRIVISSILARQALACDDDVTDV
jgi:hypothetical protein